MPSFDFSIYLLLHKHEFNLKSNIAAKLTILNKPSSVVSSAGATVAIRVHMLEDGYPFEDGYEWHMDIKYDRSGASTAHT